MAWKDFVRRTQELDRRSSQATFIRDRSLAAWFLTPIVAIAFLVDGALALARGGVGQFVGELLVAILLAVLTIVGRRRFNEEQGGWKVWLQEMREKPTTRSRRHRRPSAGPVPPAPVLEQLMRGLRLGVRGRRR